MASQSQLGMTAWGTILILEANGALSTDGSSATIRRSTRILCHRGLYTLLTTFLKPVLRYASCVLEPGGCQRHYHPFIKGRHLFMANHMPFMDQGGRRSAGRERSQAIAKLVQHFLNFSELSSLLYAPELTSCLNSNPRSCSQDLRNARPRVLSSRATYIGKY